MKKILIPLFTVLTLSVIGVCGCNRNTADTTDETYPQNINRTADTADEPTDPQPEPAPDFKFDPSLPRRPKSPVTPKEREVADSGNEENDGENQDGGAHEKREHCNHRHCRHRKPHMPAPEPLEPNN